MKFELGVVPKRQKHVSVFQWNESIHWALLNSENSGKNILFSLTIGNVTTMGEITQRTVWYLEDNKNHCKNFQEQGNRDLTVGKVHSLKGGGNVSSPFVTAKIKIM